MNLTYTITLKMKDAAAASKLDRELSMNDYETAIKTFNTIAKGLFEDIYPDGYVLEMIQNHDKRVSKKLEDF